MSDLRSMFLSEHNMRSIFVIISKYNKKIHCYVDMNYNYYIITKLYLLRLLRSFNIGHSKKLEMDDLIDIDDIYENKCMYNVFKGDRNFYFLNGYYNFENDKFQLYETGSLVRITNNERNYGILKYKYNKVLDNTRPLFTTNYEYDEIPNDKNVSILMEYFNKILISKEDVSYLLYELSCALYNYKCSKCCFLFQNTPQSLIDLIKSVFGSFVGTMRDISYLSKDKFNQNDVILNLNKHIIIHTYDKPIHPFILSKLSDDEPIWKNHEDFYYHCLPIIILPEEFNFKDKLENKLTRFIRLIRFDNSDVRLENIDELRSDFFRLLIQNHNSCSISPNIRKNSYEIVRKYSDVKTSIDKTFF